jgi:CheY-like chemotaxis protein
MLAVWKMRPTLTPNGEEALAAAKVAAATGEPFPLILIDFRVCERDGSYLVEQIASDPALASSSIVVLISAANDKLTASSKNAGSVTYLRKPVTQSTLFDTVVNAIFAQATGRRGQTALTGGRDTASQSLPAQVRPLSILLAEDDSINRRVAQQMLQLAGYHVTVAASGKRALALFEESIFDAALMDVQMPEMDGLETTAAIRKLEEQTGRHLPIIAMTAHALKGDRERCLAAGMDGYISKPVTSKDLLHTLAMHQPVAGAEEVSGMAAIFRHDDGDLDFLRELAGMMCDSAPRLVDEIHAAVEQRDAVKLEQTAHRLKGSLIPFVAPAAMKAAQALETMGHEHALSGACEAYDLLAADVQRLLAALKEIAALETVGAPAPV